MGAATYKLYASYLHCVKHVCVFALRNKRVGVLKLLEQSIIMFVCCTFCDDGTEWLYEVCDD